MSKTKKILLILLGVFSIILVGVVILLFSFTQSMKSRSR
ncbi:flagellar basal body-associated protein FliL [Peribacillus frigoritolerans]|nr:flagellar basal body-associated protein FliL [Peribacillus frigoritolerans]